MALQPGGIESGGIGHGEAVDGTRIDLGGVVDPRGARRQEAADAVAGDRDRTGRRSEEHRVAYPCAA